MTDELRKSDRSEAQREIVKVLALRTIWAVILLQSVLAPYFVSKGVELHDVFMIQAVFSASLIIGEVPTGVLSDLISRRACSFSHQLCAVSVQPHWLFLTVSGGLRLPICSLRSRTAPCQGRISRC